MSEWYVGRKPCGCLVACISIEGHEPDDISWRNEVARFCSDIVRRGMTLDRATGEYCRQNLTQCKHGAWGDRQMGLPALIP